MKTPTEVSEGFSSERAAEHKCVCMHTRFTGTVAEVNAAR